MQSIWRFDPTSLKLFIAACELGSIARAAERENRVASAVSKRIAELEEAVGTPLFYRHKKGITATPAGQCLFEHATRVVDDLLQMSAQMSGFAKGRRGISGSARTAPASFSSCPTTFAPSVRSTPVLK